MRDLKKQNDRIKEAYDRFTATFPKGMKDKYREHAETRGMSLNALINKLLEEDMKEAGDGAHQSDI